MLRFWNHEILQQTNEVLAEILRVAQELELRQPEKVILPIIYEFSADLVPSPVGEG